LNNAQYSGVSSAKTGEFLLTNLRPGKYVLYASPGVTGLGAGYYLAGGVAVDNPSKATIIEVTASGTNKAPYIITLPQARTTKAAYELYGYITDENGSPLDGVLLSAIDASGNEVLVNQQNQTDKGGYFHIVFPSAGMYSLRATKDGYQDAAGTLSFDFAASVQKTVIVMEKTNGVKKQDAAIIADLKNNDEVVLLVYPNPAEDVLHLNISADRIISEARLYNTTGELVMTSTVNASKELKLDVSSLQSGVYIIRLFSGSAESGSMKFVKK
jgi:hypothetical protein